MLPSTLYFKNVDCPFDKSGLCRRPHCHLKHDKAKGLADNIKSTRNLIKSARHSLPGFVVRQPSRAPLERLHYAASTSFGNLSDTTDDKVPGSPAYSSAVQAPTGWPSLEDAFKDREPVAIHSATSDALPVYRPTPLDQLGSSLSSTGCVTKDRSKAKLAQEDFAKHPSRDSPPGQDEAVDLDAQDPGEHPDEVEGWERRRLKVEGFLADRFR